MDTASGQSRGEVPPPPVPADPALALGAHVGWQRVKGTLHERGCESGDPPHPQNHPLHPKTSPAP